MKKLLIDILKIKKYDGGKVEKRAVIK